LREGDGADDTRSEVKVAAKLLLNEEATAGPDTTKAIAAEDVAEPHEQTGVEQRRLPNNSAASGSNLNEVVKRRSMV
jgi:hypothetical protein